METKDDSIPDISLSTEQEEALRSFLSEANIERERNGLSPVTSSTALQYLQARKFEVGKALSLFKNNQYQRSMHQLFKFDPCEEPLRSELLSGKFTLLEERHPNGSAISWFRAKLHRPTYTSHVTVLRSIVFQLDEALKDPETQKKGLIFIYDMSESSYGNFEYDLSIKVLDLLKGAYPAKLRSIFIVSAPFWFRATLAILASLLKPKIRDRLHTVTVEQLQNEIPPSCLPACLGGEHKSDHYAWLAKCMQMYKEETGRDDISAEGELLTQHQKSRYIPPRIPDSSGMNIEGFMEYMRDLGPAGIKSEYEKMRQQPLVGKFLASLHPANTLKNRYTDVMCYEHSRVRLHVIRQDPFSDYINASFIDGYKQSRSFIAAQGPLPETSGDFWRMIWEKQVLIVVMTTKCTERGRIKCCQYWPEVGCISDYATVSVVGQTSETFDDYVLRKFELQDRGNADIKHHIVHIQMTCWPDYGVPSSAKSCLNIIQQVRMFQQQGVKRMGVMWEGHPRGPPILVHCSAGIGRTGTFCVIDHNILRYEDIGTVDIYTTLCQIRVQRAFAVQTADQYEFCHLALLEHFLSLDSVSDTQKERIQKFLVQWHDPPQQSSDSDD